MKAVSSSSGAVEISLHKGKILSSARGSREGGPRSERMNDLSVRVSRGRKVIIAETSEWDEAEERTKLYLSRISRFIEAEHMQSSHLMHSVAGHI